MSKGLGWMGFAAAVGLALPLLAPAAVLTENWESHAVGTDGSTPITGWRVTKSGTNTNVNQATIVENTAGSKVLKLAPYPASSNSLTVLPSDDGLTTKEFATGGSTHLSLKADVQDLNSKSGPMQLFLSNGTAGSNNFQVFTDNGAIKLRKKGAGDSSPSDVAATTRTLLTDSDGPLPSDWQFAGNHTFEMVVDVQPTQDVVKLYINNILVLEGAVTSNRVDLSAQRVSVSLYAGNGNDVQFDNVVLTAPEPAAAGLLALGSLLAARRRRS